ncbi:hypothetical protein [Flagellimonas sp. S3867]|uniref:hypothetical protein n=1 Tax=Flagellimonas sp. S3867 TaxID=2768063 RepID=UPI001681E67B|nr:hypothetical protein [Flagellimonas sp. S3867]
MEKKNISFFNAADEANKQEVDSHSFEESLIYNVLFQRKLVLQDAYYINSRYLRAHVLDNPFHQFSLFELASQEGIIVPTIRNRNLSFFNNLKELSSERNYGKNEHNLDIKILENTRYEAFIKNCHFESESTLDNGVELAKGYRDLVEHFIMGDKIPTCAVDNEKSIQIRTRVWQATEEWRNSSLKRAIEITNNGGLSRSEAFFAIARNIKSTAQKNGKEFDVKKGTHLDYNLKFLEDDQEKQFALQILWSWLNKCHHKNMAEKLGAGVNFSSYKPDSYFLSDAIFIDQPKNENIKPNDLEITLPAIDFLRKVEPKEILEVRKNRSGPYFEALLNYSYFQSRPNRERLERTLKDYCWEISQLVSLGKRIDTTVQYGPTEIFSHLVGGGSALTSAAASGNSVQIYCAVIGSICLAIPMIVSNYKTYRKKVVKAPYVKNIELTF